MNRIFLAASALAAVFTGSVASAQDGYHGRDDRGGYGRDHGGDGDDQRYRNDDRRDRGDDRRERGDDRRDRGDDRRDDRAGRDDYRRQARYARGMRYRGDGTYFSDYGRYGYRAPPRGYRYYRTGNGDVVLAAIATGIIASVIAGNSRY